MVRTALLDQTKGPSNPCSPLPLFPHVLSMFLPVTLVPPQGQQEGEHGRGRMVIILHRTPALDAKVLLAGLSSLVAGNGSPKVDVEAAGSFCIREQPCLSSGTLAPASITFLAVSEVQCSPDRPTSLYHPLVCHPWPR